MVSGDKRYRVFQHTAARRRLVPSVGNRAANSGFQHTAARRRLANSAAVFSQGRLFQHTAARRRLANDSSSMFSIGMCFNTQPPEGGWNTDFENDSVRAMFQHTAARRRLVEERMEAELLDSVSTHSRPKAAGFNTRQNHTDFLVSTHSRPKAAGYGFGRCGSNADVSTHSRPKAAGKP